MAAKAFDLTEYKHLLAEAHPALIETEEENERVLALVQKLMRKERKSVFGSKGITSEVLRGKRGISKEKAKVLSATFHVPVELFI